MNEPLRNESCHLIWRIIFLISKLNDVATSAEELYELEDDEGERILLPVSYVKEARKTMLSRSTTVCNATQKEVCCFAQPTTDTDNCRSRKTNSIFKINKTQFLALLGTKFVAPLICFASYQIDFLLIMRSNAL